MKLNIQLNNNTAHSICANIVYFSNLLVCGAKHLISKERVFFFIWVDFFGEKSNYLCIAEAR